ncbi:MAG: PilN domain-containing protein [Christensenella sp.]
MKDLNFFESIKKHETKHKVGTFLRNGVIILVVCAVLVGGATAWFYVQRNIAVAAAEKIDAEIADIKAMSTDYAALEENKQKLSALKTYNSIIEEFTVNLNTYPHVDKALMDEINAKKPQDVNIDKLDYADGLLKLECSSQNTASPADFVRNLRSSKLIADVGYNGYYAAETVANTPEAQGMVTFTVSCVLKGGDAK